MLSFLMFLWLSCVLTHCFVFVCVYHVFLWSHLLVFLGHTPSFSPCLVLVSLTVLTWPSPHSSAWFAHWLGLFSRPSTSGGIVLSRCLEWFQDCSPPCTPLNLCFNTYLFHSLCILADLDKLSTLKVWQWSVFEPDVSLQHETAQMCSFPHEML